MVQPSNVKISELPELTSPAVDTVLPVVSAGVTYKITPADLLKGREARFNVMDYGATGLGVADETTPFGLALAAAALVGGTVFVPKGAYNLPTLALPSGVSLEGDGESSVLLNCHLTCTGTTGEEIPFTAPALKGATSIAIPATGLNNAWLRLASVINSQSPDAGVDQLGTNISNRSFFAEFVRVKTGAASSATLYGSLIFPYSNTPGPDSHTFTTSVARVVTFHEGSVVRRIKFLGRSGSATEQVRLQFCRGLVIEDCTFDNDDKDTHLIRMLHSLDCEVIRPRGFGKRTSVTGAVHNGIVITSSQSCMIRGGMVQFCYQPVDVTYAVGDSAYRGGPSIACGASGTYAKDAFLDGFTSHYGCFQSIFEDVVVTGASNYGLRIRGRQDRVSGARISGLGVAGSGLLISNAAAVDSQVTGCRVDGGLYGLVYTHPDVGLEALEALFACGACEVSGNLFRNNSGYGVFLDS
jgi:hypothetical protein